MKSQHIRREAENVVENQCEKCDKPSGKYLLCTDCHNKKIQEAVAGRTLPEEMVVVEAKRSCGHKESLLVDKNHPRYSYKMDSIAHTRCTSCQKLVKYEQGETKLKKKIAHQKSQIANHRAAMEHLRINLKAVDSKRQKQQQKETSSVTINVEKIEVRLR